MSVIRAFNVVVIRWPDPSLLLDGPSYSEARLTLFVQSEDLEGLVHDYSHSCAYIAVSHLSTILTVEWRNAGP